MSDADFPMSSHSSTHAITTFPHLYDGYADHAFRGAAPKVDQFIGVIRNGPASGGGGDYADARYFVDRAIPEPDSSEKSALKANVDRLPGVGQTITATNIAELALGSHLLPVGTLVQVFVLHARGSPGNKVYVFDLEPLRSAVVQITSRGGAGVYGGKILGGVAGATVESSLAMAMGMTVPPAENAVILNLEEDALPGNRLKINSYSVGVIRGATTDHPPRQIVLIRGSLGKLDSATALGGTSEGDETADDATWSKDVDGTPLDLYVITRVVYNPAGDQTLYSFVRKLSFDARGELSKVSAETRISVDVTEPCP